DGATVQSGNATMGGNVTSLTAALPNPVNPATTWLLLSHQVANADGSAAELLVSGRVASSTQLAFTRAGNGASHQITWYAVSFTNGTSVQSATLALNDSATSATTAITPVNAARSIAVAGGAWQRAGTTAFASSANTGFG